MNPIISNFIKQAKIADNQAILDAAIKYYDNNDPDDPKHRWDHVLDTMEVAKKIRGRDLTPQEFGMLAFHDSGYKHPKGYSYSKKIHGPLGARIFRKEAPGLGYSKDEIKHIAKVIAYHNHQPKAKSNLLNDDLQLLMYSADEGTPMNIEEDAVKYYKKGLAGVYKGVDPNSKDFIKQLVNRVRNFSNLSDSPRLKYYHEIYPTYHQDLYDYWHSDKLEKLYNKLNRKKKASYIDFPKEELPNLKDKDKFYTTRVSKDYNKYKLGDEVTTPWNSKYTIDEEELYDNIDKHRFRDELTPEQVKLLKKYKKIKLLGLKKKASKLYTYVDPDADLSKGILSMRNAPDDAVIKRYKGRVPEGSSKADIISRIEKLDKERPDWIYAFDSPIPDRANEGLLKFRDSHKLVSFDPSKIERLKKVLRKYSRKHPEEVDVNNFEPLKRVQWKRKPKDGYFRYSPAYKLLTEDGRISPELLNEENMEDKYSIHGAILGCLGDHAKDFDYEVKEDLPDDPWKAIIKTKPMTMDAVRKFHKYHNIDVDKAGVPYYFLTKNDRTGDKAVWYSDDDEPISINSKKEKELAKQIGLGKGLVKEQLDFKF